MTIEIVAIGRTPVAVAAPLALFRNRRERGYSALCRPRQCPMGHTSAHTSQSSGRHIQRVTIQARAVFVRPRSRSPAAAGAGLLTLLVWFAERGFPQANRITLTKSCRCNNS
jgi:hypothetical protein